MVQSALAKVRRVLPAAPARRIDAVIDTVGFTAEGDGLAADRGELASVRELRQCSQMLAQALAPWAGAQAESASQPELER
jgi:hypothetical protein